MNEEQILVYFNNEKMVISIGVVFSVLNNTFVFLNENKGVCALIFNKMTNQKLFKNTESSLKIYFKCFFESILSKLKNKKIKIFFPMRKINIILFLLIFLFILIFIREPVAQAPIRKVFSEKEQLKVLVYIHLKKAISGSSFKIHLEENKFKQLLGLNKKNDDKKETFFDKRILLKSKIRKSLIIPKKNGKSKDPDVLFFLNQEVKK